MSNILSKMAIIGFALVSLVASGAEGTVGQSACVLANNCETGGTGGGATGGGSTGGGSTGGGGTGVGSTGGTTGGGTTGEEDDNFPTITDAKLAKTIMTGNVVSLKAAYEVNPTRSVGTFTVVANNDGGYSVSMNGQTFNFVSSEDITGQGFSYLRFIPTSEMLTLGVRSSAVSKTYVDTGLLTYTGDDGGTPITNLNYFTYGIETTTMPNASSAELEGEATLWAYDKGGDILVLKYGVGKIVLNANFSSQTFSGSIDNFDMRLPADQPLTAIGTGTGKITIADGTISGNGMSATISGNSSFNSQVGGAVTGTLTGKFFGANAKEAGGVFTFDNSQIVGLGNFVAR